MGFEAAGKRAREFITETDVPLALRRAEPGVGPLNGNTK